MKLNRGRSFLSPHHALLLVVPLLGCSAGPEGELVEAQSALDGDDEAREAELRLEDGLLQLGDDEVIITYREGSTSMVVEVDLTPLHDDVVGRTVELRLVASTPGKEATTYDLIWTPDEEHGLPRIEVPVVGLGEHEVTLVRAAIDGRVVVDEPIAHGRMHMNAPAADVVVAADLVADAEVSSSCGVGSTLYGSWDDDFIEGTQGDDEIYLYAGDDVAYGYECRDAIYGGPGSDALFGGPGDDWLFGGPGGDTLRGGPGQDTLRGGPGPDLLRGGQGHDVLRGGQDDDTLRGGPGHDTLRGGEGDDTLRGGPGYDVCHGGPGYDVFVSCEVANQ